MKIVNLLNRVIGNNGRLLKKANEYMYWSPFISHHKPKLQINIQTQKLFTNDNISSKLIEYNFELFFETFKTPGVLMFMQHVCMIGELVL